jgi:glycosyltransferase involved in cell wall biosynthesis/GT2 family glycosyltransferase
VVAGGDDEKLQVDDPAVSVVIPTYNRRELLHRVLGALAAQTTASAFEVVVVSDGSTDGTDDYLRSSATPLPVVAVTQGNGGPAAARNAGVSAARAPIVLFVDDDVVPAPDLVEQHLHAHRDSPGDTVVIGPMLTPPDARLSPWVAWEQHKLYKQYDALRDGVFECTFRQFYTGNASVPRQRVIDVGMFDTGFRRSEDVELAFRMHEAGLSFRFVPEARGFHYANRSFESWLATPFAYGRNDVDFIDAGRSWVAGSLPAEFEARNPMIKALTRTCVPRPRLARAATAALRRLGTSRMLPDALRQHALSALFNLTYYSGVAAGLGSGRRFLRFIDGAEPSAGAPLRALFVLEQTLGHVTHGKNLMHLVVAGDDLDPSFLPVPFELHGVAARLPGYRNWTIRAGLRARRGIRRHHRRVGIDVMFIHTQVPAILAGRWMRKIPTVVSLDATPRQYDEMGEQYGHPTGSSRVERWKMAANRRCFQRARHLVAWSEWTRQGLIDDYGVEADRITVITPGVDIARWERAPSTDPSDRPVRILFVGGDLERKGGFHLLEAVGRLRDDAAVGAFELHLVTRAPVPPQAGVIVHDDLTPNSPALIALYHECDIFCLPTLADSLAIVLSEAAVGAMALVATDVGAIGELVHDGETGILVTPGDVDELTDALRRLVTDPQLRDRLGTAAQALVRRNYDANLNARRIVGLLTDAGRRDA